MNYKLLYVAFVSDKLGGVEQKIIAQFDAMHALGSDVHLYLVSSFTPGKTFAVEIEKRPGVNILVNSPEKIRNPWARRKEKFDIITSALTNYDPKSTLVYLRYPLADILFLRFLKKNKEFRFITEHQEIENSLPVRIYRYGEILFGKAVRRRITGFIGVTTEITDFERSLAGNKGHYFKTIGNGIAIDRYQLRIPANYFQNGEIHILFVGTGYRYHGLARLITSIDSYYQNKNITCEIKVKVAGDSIEMDENKNLTNRLNLCSKITFLGDVEIENLNELFNWANVGMASMGLHTIGLSKSSTLKVREYFARGLPFFWSSSDDDFPARYPYILQFKPENSSFDITRVISFVEKVSQDESHPQRMREYSIAHLNWPIKIKELLAFLEEIIAAAP